MPKRVDLAETQDEGLEFDYNVDDQDLDDDEQEGSDDYEDSDDADDEDDAEDDKPKRAPTGRRQDIAGLERSLSELKQMVTGGTKADQQKVKKVDQTLGALLQQGWNQEQVAALYQTVQALRSDLEDEYKESTAKERQAALADTWADAVSAEISRYAKKFPAVGWSRAEIERRTFELLAKGRGFQGARDRYNGGKRPLPEDTQKSVGRIVETFLKETGIKSGATSDQLDVRPSRTRPAPAVTEKGEVNLDRLNDFERTIYQQTLNETKNKDLAMKALRAVRGFRP